MSAGDVTSVCMRFKLRAYCRGALGMGLLDVGEIPYPDTFGLGKNCFFRSFHRFSCWAHSKIVRLLRTDQSKAWLHTCMERGTLSSSRVVSFSLPVSLALDGFSDAGVQLGSIMEAGREVGPPSSAGIGVPPEVEGLGWISGREGSLSKDDGAVGGATVGVSEFARSPCCVETAPALDLVAFRLIS